LTPNELVLTFRGSYVCANFGENRSRNATMRVLADGQTHRHGTDNNKMLSYCRETALQGALVLAKSGRLEWGDNIYGHYRSIFNHCDIIGLQSYQIWLKNAK